VIYSQLKNLFNLNENKIYARKCKVVEVNDNDTIKDFLNKNHVQGWTPSKYKYGLYHENKLVSLMTFGKSIKNKNYDFELIRFCSLKDHNIVGSASKLFSHFMKNEGKNKNIISYSDISKTKGSLYEVLGFKNIRISSPSYW
jgi:hypothetical protein